MEILIATRGKDKIYLERTEELAGQKFRLGYVVLGNGRKIKVNIEDLLSRSSWDMVKQLGNKPK